MVTPLRRCGGGKVAFTTVDARAQCYGEAKILVACGTCNVTLLANADLDVSSGPFVVLTTGASGLVGGAWWSNRRMHYALTLQ